MKQTQLNRIEEGQKRIEAKLDALLEALADEGEKVEPKYDLDGNLIDIGDDEEHDSLD